MADIQDLVKKLAAMGDEPFIIGLHKTCAEDLKAGGTMSKTASFSSEGSL